MDRATEVAKKVEQVRRWMSHAEREGVLFVSQPGFAWITGGGDDHVSLGEQAGVAYVLLTETRVLLLAPQNEVDRLLDEELADLSFEVETWPWYRPELCLEAIHRACPSRRVCADLAWWGFPHAGPGLCELRYRLVAPEVERYRQLGAAAAAAVEGTCRAARVGQTERELAAWVAGACRKEGILPLVVLVAGDERIAQYRHPIPTEHAVQKTLMVAMTGRRHGLHASLTRMVCFGQPDDELVRRHRAVCRVDARFHLDSRPGVSLGEVFRLAAAQYELEGFPEEWLRHHQGGLTGYAGREIFATPHARHVLRAGEVLAWNPTITQVKSEDTLLVTDDGVEVLTRSGLWPMEPVRLPQGTQERPVLLVKEGEPS